MKFFTSNLPKNFLAGIGTATIFFIIIYLNISATPPVYTERISWDEAMKLKTAYLASKPLLVEYVDASGKVIRAPLQGFKLDARMIDEVINHNQNAPGGDGEADALMVYFGVEGFSGTGPTAIPNYKIIAVGVKDGKLMKNPTSGNISQSSVMDKADPCPPNCPR